MVDRFYKKVKVSGVERKYLDFNKIRLEKPPIKIIISERGRQGKSFNAKEHLLDRYLNSNKTETAVGIFNQQQQIEDNYDKFLINNVKSYPKRGKDFGINRTGVFDRVKKIYVIKFLSLGTCAKYKHGRDSGVGTFVYDEFNEGLDLVQNRQMHYLESLLHTFSDPSSPQSHSKLNLFVFGNQKTMNVPLFVDLGIQSLTKEIQLYYNMKKAGQQKEYLVMVYSPKFEKEQLVELDKSWIYHFSKRANLDRASYENRNIFDSSDGIVEKEDLDDYGYGYDSIGFSVVNGRGFEIGQSKENADKFFIAWVSNESEIPKDAEKCGFIPKDAEGGIVNQGSFLAKILSVALGSGNLKFADLISKMAFLNIVW